MGEVLATIVIIYWIGAIAAMMADWGVDAIFWPIEVCRRYYEKHWK